MLPEGGSAQLTFPKKERICSKLIFQQLLRQNRSCFRYPFKYYYLSQPVSDVRKHHAIAIAVPKKLHKKAVDRNRIKRLIRESWRLNHQIYLNQENYCFDILFVYIGKSILSYQIIETAIREIMNELAHLKN